MLNFKQYLRESVPKGEYDPLDYWYQSSINDEGIFIRHPKEGPSEPVTPMDMFIHNPGWFFQMLEDMTAFISEYLPWELQGAWADILEQIENGELTGETLWGFIGMVLQNWGNPKLMGGAPFSDELMWGLNWPFDEGNMGGYAGQAIDAINDLINQGQQGNLHDDPAYNALYLQFLQQLLNTIHWWAENNP